MAGILVAAQDPPRGDQDAASKKPEAMALLADGQQVPAALVEIDGEGRMVVDTAEGRQRWSPRDWLAWGAFRDRDRGTAILLVSGAVLMGDVVAIQPAEIHVDPVWFEPVSLPKSAVRGVVWRLPVHPTDRDRLLRRITTVPAEQDTVWLVNGDQLEGVVSSWPQVPGAWTHLHAAGVADEPPAEVAFENVTGVALKSINQQPGPLPFGGGGTYVGLSDGSRLWVRT
ncbi:MAG: hypothetical protein AB7F89_13795, partial [Pirellulaceae bacterium]